MSKFSDNKGAVFYDEGIVLNTETIAANDVVGGSSKADDTRKQGFRTLKLEGHAYFKNGAADEFLIFGIAVGLSAAEVEECLEADPQFPQDAAAQEKVMRPVFPLGAVHGDGASGRLMSFKHNLRWSVKEGSSFLWWAYNPDSVAHSTAGQRLLIFAKHFGVWLED